jgi:indole-3-glycerol phosphate synthase
VSGDFLQQMARGSAQRVAEAKRRIAESRMQELALAAAPPPRLALGKNGFDLIAEMKRRSPAAGPLAAASDTVVERVESYARAGAVAVSVLTEPTRFDGSLQHLETASRALQAYSVPAMRKDFVVDPYQLLEARVAGAGGVLLILRMLSGEQISALLDCAHDVGLFVLMETFDEIDIEVAHRVIGALPADRLKTSAPLLVGVNCRDLTTLAVVPGRLERLAQLLPEGVPRVAESGVAAADDAARAAGVGYDLALVGSALMVGPDPTALVREMLAAGRRARAQRGS